MTQTAEPASTIGVICDRGSPDASRMEAFLRAQSLSGHWYARHDLDDADRDVIAGRLHTVVFLRWQDLLEGIFNGEVSFGRWRDIKVDLRFVEPAGTDDLARLAAVSQAWTAHQRQCRRRRTVSGILLSLIALAAAFITVRM